MKAPYIVGHIGKYYPAITELPEEVARLIEPSLKEYYATREKCAKAKEENVVIKNNSTFK